MMSTAPRYPLQRRTLEDYRSWQGDWELVDGFPVAMSPSPFGPHERMVDDIADQFKAQLRREQCHCRIYRNLDWIISAHDVVRPDLIIVCGEQPERHLDTTPELCVEVLSDAMRRHDQLVKRPLYRDHGVPFYLIAQPGSDSVQLFVNEEGREIEAVELAGEQSREIILPSGCSLCMKPSAMLVG